MHPGARPDQAHLAICATSGLTHHREGIFLFTLFHLPARPAPIPLIGLSALPLRLDQASIAEALPRLSTSSLVFIFPWVH